MSTESGAPRGRRRSRWVVVAVTVLVAAAGGLFWAQRSTGTDDAAAPAALPTVPVTVGTMVDQTTVRGTLLYPAGQAVDAGPAGVLTSLPAVGTVLAPGDTLYTVDTRPVVLMAGSLPVYRSFEAGMTPGADITQLEQGLAAMGLFGGTPDDRFTAATGTAVRAWQRAQGVPQTGTVDRSALLFGPGPLRVGAWSSHIGAQVAAGTELFGTSGTDKVVDVDLALTDQQLAVVGAAVTVTLPDGTQVPAAVATVGEAVERQGTDGSGKVVRPVVLTLAGQAPAGAFSQADVAVAFTSTLAQDVLTVPVEALLALDATSFGVEVPDGDGTRVLPVTLGVFASGRVQVSGAGIVAGLDVVVPS